MTTLREDVLESTATSQFGTRELVANYTHDGPAGEDLPPSNRFKTAHGRLSPDKDPQFQTLTQPGGRVERMGETFAQPLRQEHNLPAIDCSASFTHASRPVRMNKSTAR